MANTIFQIKRSEVTATPASLSYGELAYSFLSGKMFIGDSTGAPVVVGGNHYTTIIDAATASATANTLVMRDAQGAFAGELLGNAATASKWQAPITISTSGAATGSVSMDGSANVDIALTLANSGVVAGTYGDTLNIPVVTVNEKGIVTSMNTATISTSFDLQADSTGPYTFNNGDTLFILGGDGVNSEVLNNTFTVAVDDTVIRTAPNFIDANATSQSVSGNLSLGGSLTVAGDLVVNGNTTYINVETLTVEDSLIQLANNNTSDAVSIGFVGKYNDGSAKSTGFFRNVADKEFYLFDGVTDNLDGVSSIDPTTATNFGLATLNANLTGGTVSGLSAVIAVADGGLGNDTFTVGQHIVYDATGKFVSQANTGAAGIWGTANTYSELTVDNYGQVTAVTQKDIALPVNQLVGTLRLDQGGTGLSSVAAGSILWSNGASDQMQVATGSSEGSVLMYNADGSISWSHIDAGTF